MRYKVCYFKSHVFCYDVTYIRVFERLAWVSYIESIKISIINNQLEIWIV